MTAQKSTTNEMTKTNNINKITESFTILSAGICAIFAVEFIGIAALKLFHYPVQNFVYNFVFGFGIITGIAFAIAVIQEILEK